MRKNERKRFLVWGVIEEDTADEIRSILELAGNKAKMTEIPFDYIVNMDDIIEAIEEVYDGDEEDVTKVVDVKAIAAALGDTKSEAWNEFDDSMKHLVQDALADWIESRNPELEDDFPDLFDGDDEEDGED